MNARAIHSTARPARSLRRSITARLCPLPPRTMPSVDDALTRCSFCGKLEHQVKRLIHSNSGAHICNECVEFCVEILTEEGLMTTPPPTDQTTP